MNWKQMNGYNDVLRTTHWIVHYRSVREERRKEQVARRLPSMSLDEMFEADMAALDKKLSR